MLTNNYSSKKVETKQLQLKKYSLPIIIYTLLGLAATVSLIYLQGDRLSQAALADSPTNVAPFSAFSANPAQAIANQSQTCPLDVMVVFDVSASMEDQTICHDCWVRTSYHPNYPNNGYFNPLPYNAAWATPGTDNQSIPQSGLCTSYPPQPFIANTFKYLTVEAELYSTIVGAWDLDVGMPGQGFWAIQRGSKRSGNNPLGEDNDQRNAAGDPTLQSSNVCRPNVIGGALQGIDCTVGGSGDNVCSDADGGVAADCSAYIATRPFETYNGNPGNIPLLNGAAYNSDCFSGSALSGTCWSSSPFNSILGNGPSNVPWVEYDFTPVWTQPTSIWIRAIGGGDQSFTWVGPSPDQLQPDLNGGGVSNNIVPWRKVIYWQVNNALINQRKDNINADYQNTPTDDNSRHFQKATTWRDNRAENGLWRWIKLGSTATVSGTQYTLKLYQGSAGYKIDKIVFTNDSSGSTPEAGAANPTIPAALRRDANGNTASNPGDMLGPPASFGSATREACNVCNPAFGYTVNPSECTCKLRATDTANGGYGSGIGCTFMLTQTNQLQRELKTGLYSGLQPLRSAQEAVKNFARKLNPQFDQLGLVPFTSGGDNTAAQSDATRRSKLQCLQWATNNSAGGAAECYDTTLFPNPISYTNVINVVEKHWAESGTDIAIGLREGLEELGISAPGNAVNSNCTATVNDLSACDPSGTARRVIVLITDGTPNSNPGNCNGSSGGRPDLWDGLVGTEDADFECAMYYAYLAAQNNTTLYTIGIGAGVDFDLLTAMATGTDPRGDQPDVPIFAGASGQFFSAAKPTDLEAIFDEILTQAPSCQPSIYLPLILKQN